jgi:hypothetical protein
LDPKSGDRLELRVVDAPLARALFHGIPAARLLARTRPASSDTAAAAAFDAHLKSLLGVTHERVKRAMARHARVALDEGPLRASESTVAVLAWAVASAPETDASLAEIAPAGGEPSVCDEGVVAECAAYDERLADRAADRRAPAFEACVRLTTRAVLGPLPWDRVRAVLEQLERSGLGVRLLGEAPATIFPRRVDDEIAASDRRMTALDRAPLDTVLAKDPRELAATLGRVDARVDARADARMDPRADHAAEVDGDGARLATFLADLSLLLVHEGTLVAALLAPDPQDAAEADHSAPAGPTEWTASTAAALANALERGATTLPRVRAAAVRGGEAALDAIGAEMLDVGLHASASAAFAEILSGSRRPRDVLRLVTYFAIAPDPVPAARALGACVAAELPRVLGAWLDAMLPHDDEDAPESSAARVTACIASLKPYPQLYRAVSPLLARLDVVPISR